MAERRMFASKIIESDAFIDLSSQAQMLYIHLSMAADDDGFLNNAKSIKRATGCTDNELNELFEKRFILDLGDGITVIKHWKINNYIQKDRYKPTAYQEKYELLEIKPNGAYTEKNKPNNSVDTDCIQYMDTGCIQDSGERVYSLDTQVSIGKVSIDKNNNIGETTRFKKPTLEEVQEYAEEKGYKIDAQRFVDYYESKGWYVGKSKMKKWQAAVNNWAKNDKTWEKTEINSKKPDFDINAQSAEPQDFDAIRKRLFNETN